LQVFIFLLLKLWQKRTDSFTTERGWGEVKILCTVCM
jgi:hypothetical protein